MNNLEELNKACSMAEKAGLGLLKSDHHKAYTRTSASGAVSNIAQKGTIHSDDAFTKIKAAGGGGMSTSSDYIHYHVHGQPRKIKHTDASDGNRYVDADELRQHLDAMAEKAGLGLMKSHVKQYTRADGTMVQEHDDSRQQKYHAAYKKASEATDKARKSGSHADHAAAAAAHEEAFNHAAKGWGSTAREHHGDMYHYHNDRAGEFSNLD